jgi:hypothetical protein
MRDTGKLGQRLSSRGWLRDRRTGRDGARSRIRANFLGRAGDASGVIVRPEAVED